MCFASPPQPPPMPALPQAPSAPATPPPAPSVISDTKVPTIGQASARSRARQAATGTAQFRMPQVSVTPTAQTANGGGAPGLNIPK